MTSSLSPGAIEDTNPLGPTYRLLTIGILLNTLAVAFEALAISTVMPLVANDLGRHDLYGWVFSGFLLTNIVGIVVAGLHADAKGPAAPFSWGVVLFAIGLAVGGLSPSMPMLIAARALQGFGGGALASIAYVSVGRAYPEAARPRMLALLSTGWVVPGLIGPALAGLIGGAFGWRWVFLGLAPLPLIAAVLALPRLRAIPGGIVGNDARQRVGLALLLALGTTGLLTGLQWIAHNPWAGDGGIAAGPWIGIAVIAVGLALMIPALQRLLPAGTLRAAPGLPAAIATIGLINVAFFGAESFLPLAIVDLRGESIHLGSLVLAPVAVVSMMFTAVTVAWTSGAWIQERWAATGQRRRVVMTGLVGLFLGLCGALLLLFAFTPVILAPFFWIFAGIGMGLTNSTVALIVLETSSSGQEGQASSSIQLASMLGSGIGAGVGGALVASIGTTGGAMQHALVIHFTSMIVVCGLTLLVAWRLPARHRFKSPVETAVDPAGAEVLTAA